MKTDPLEMLTPDEIKAKAANVVSPLNVYQMGTGSEDEHLIPDLLADLAHWCDENGQDFSDHLQTAFRHYQEETGGEGRAFPLVLEML